jgi:hypothetical protein
MRLIAFPNHTGDSWRVRLGAVMGGGGKGGSPQPMQATSQNVSQTNIPEYARPYFEDLLQKTQQESLGSYQPFSGQRLADTSADTNAAYNQIRNIDPNAGFAQANSYINQGAGLGQQGANYAATAAGYGQQMMGQAGQVSQAGNSVAGWGNQVGQFGQQVAGGYKPIDAPQTWNEQTASQYMSPYQQDVTDIAKRYAIRDDNIARLQRNTAAEQAGAFGGSRQAVMEGMAGRDLGNRLSDLQAQGLQSAYTNAQQQFGQDRSATMAAQIQNAQNALQGGNMMTSAGNLYGTSGQLQASAGQLQGQAGALTNAAGQLTDDSGRLITDSGRATAALSAQQQQQQMQHAQGLQQIGAAQQQQQQAGLDMGYTDFLNQRDYPRQQLNFYSGILRGVPVQPQMDTTTYQPAPNPMNQLLGLGVSAAGAYMGTR